MDGDGKLGTTMTLPAEVRARFMEHGIMARSVEIVGWSKVDDRWAGSKWRAECIDGTFSGPFSIIFCLPCFWPHALFLSPIIVSAYCCTMVCCGGCAASKAQYVIVSNMGIDMVHMKPTCCRQGMEPVERQGFMLLDTFLENEPHGPVACWRSCCCLSPMPRIDGYRTKGESSGKNCFRVPTLTLNGFENSPELVAKIREMEERAQRNPFGAMIGQMGIELHRMEVRRNRQNSNNNNNNNNAPPAHVLQLGNATVQAAQKAMMERAMPACIIGDPRANEDRLRELDDLAAKGFLSEAEYERKRAEILASI